jgi:hypothetical protein
VFFGPLASLLHKVLTFLFADITAIIPFWVVGREIHNNEKNSCPFP